MGTQRGAGAGRLVVVAALLLAATTSSAAAEPLLERGIDAVCPAPGASETPGDAGFADLGLTHAAAITCAVDYGLVGGFEDGTFRPGQAVTRGQMASLVAAWLRVATGFALPLPEDPPFSDIEGGTHAEAIARLAAARIVDGRADGTFEPDAPLNRGQFAQVMVRAISFADVFAVDGPLPPPGDPGALADVEGTTFEAAIGALVGTGITVGVADGTFGRGLPVTRGQLATFLMRGAEYLDRHQRWKPTARTVVLVANLEAANVVAPPGVEPPSPSAARGTATLIVNAFDGTLVYAVELADVPGPFSPGSGATVHVGSAGEIGPAVLVLADGAALDAAAGNRGIGGAVVQADSEVRFADLVAEPGGAYLTIANLDHPGGLVRGQFRAVE